MTEKARLEFLVEPVSPGKPGKHVLKAVTAARSHGLAVEMGAFGNTAGGSFEEVAAAVGDLVSAALDHGATRISIQVVTGEGQAALHVGGLQEALTRMIDQVEAELGGTLAELGREGKQEAVRLLDERGAFLLRGAIEDVAVEMGVSRITIYNYLNATRDETSEDN